MNDDRKTKQLCAQVRRVLSQYISLESQDEVLQSLFVDSVEPSPDATRLLVTLHVPQDFDVERGEVLARLAAAKADVRAEVSRAIHRRKTPDLEFMVIRAPA